MVKKEAKFKHGMIPLGPFSGGIEVEGIMWEGTLTASVADWQHRGRTNPWMPKVLLGQGEIGQLEYYRYAYRHGGLLPFGGTLWTRKRWPILHEGQSMG